MLQYQLVKIAGENRRRN